MLIFFTTICTVEIFEYHSKSVRKALFINYEISINIAHIQLGQGLPLGYWPCRYFNGVLYVYSDHTVTAGSHTLDFSKCYSPLQVNIHVIAHLVQVWGCKLSVLRSVCSFLSN